MALTQEQLDFFWQNGYVRCGKVLENDQIDLLRVEYDRVLAEAIKQDDYRNLAVEDASSSETKQAAPLKVLQVMNPHLRSIHFTQLLYNSAILDRVEDLIGPNIMLHHNQAIWKPPFEGGPVLWHQDNAYWKCRPANLVSCWLTLNDVDEDNGAMQMIPGSHLHPLWHDSAQKGPLMEMQGVDESKRVVVDLPAGGCMFHHCQTLHRSAPNTTDRQRRAHAIHFMPPGTFHTAGNLRYCVGYEHPMLRAHV